MEATGRMGLMRYPENLKIIFLEPIDDSESFTRLDHVGVKYSRADIVADSSFFYKRPHRPEFEMGQTFMEFAEHR